MAARRWEERSTCFDPFCPLICQSICGSAFVFVATFFALPEATTFGGDSFTMLYTLKLWDELPQLKIKIFMDCSRSVDLVLMIRCPGTGTDSTAEPARVQTGNGTTLA